MRLLRTDSRDPSVLEEFIGQEAPPYVMLSHTWEGDEVLFLDVLSGIAAQRKAFSKVTSTLEQARQDGFDHVWIDTCCIDKHSSAELSEAINSMFTLYADTAWCYAFLADVWREENQVKIWTDFQRRRWFTRGWTLQELRARRDSIFYSQDWQTLSTNIQLLDHLSGITKIAENVLTGERSFEEASIAARMSWAANRNTTRIEDAAYCLIGDFSISMPMLYGKGRRAFLRLQEEIIKQSDDPTVFACRDVHDGRSEHGLLADSPAVFRD